MRFIELTSNEKLDKVLNCIYSVNNADFTFGAICARVGVFDDAESQNEVFLTIEHLGNVDKYIHQVDEGLYRINFAGKKFKEDGGYAKQFERDSSDMLRERIIALSVASGTGGLLILEFWKYFHKLIWP